MDMTVSPAMSSTRPVLPLSQARALREAPPPQEDVEDAEAASLPEAALPPEKKSGIKWWSKENFSFKDILDMLNPLQHLPVISTLYRAWTGEGIGGVARIIGGAIYGRAGGFIGMATSIVNAAIGAFTGKDIGERVYAAVFGDPKVPEATALAATSSPTSAGTRLALSLAPIAQAAPAGAAAVTYRPSPTADTLDGDWNDVATDRTRRSISAAPRETTIFRGRITREVIDGLDLYDQMAPLRAPRRQQAVAEKENDYTRRRSRDDFKE